MGDLRWLCQEEGQPSFGSSQQGSPTGATPQLLTAPSLPLDIFESKILNLGSRNCDKVTPRWVVRSE